MGFIIMGMLAQFAVEASVQSVFPWLALCGACLGAGGALSGILWARFVATFSVRAVYLFVMLSNVASLAVFLLLPVIWNGVGGLANACAQLGTLVAGIILLCMVADVSRTRNVSTALLFSVSMLCVSGAQCAGSFFGFLRAEALRAGDVTLTAMALAAVYAVFMVSTFLFKDRSFKEDASAIESDRRGGASAEAPVQDLESLSMEELRKKQEEAFGRRCSLVAERARFTPREKEVFMLVSRGKTNAAIADELVVSENTVKFHVKGIYQKLGVHSKAEVMALVEEELFDARD